MHIIVNIIINLNSQFWKKRKYTLYASIYARIKIKKSEFIMSQEIGVCFSAVRNYYLITRDVRLCIGK